MTEEYADLRSNVSMLGQLLGKNMGEHLGEEFLDKIENIRQLAKSSRAGNDKDGKALIDVLTNLSDDELLPVARAFTHFLNFYSPMVIIFLKNSYKILLAYVPKGKLFFL